MTRPRTLGKLGASGWQPVSVKDEMRRHLIRKCQPTMTALPEIW